MLARTPHPDVLHIGTLRRRRDGAAERAVGHHRPSRIGAIRRRTATLNPISRATSRHVGRTRSRRLFLIPLLSVSAREFPMSASSRFSPSSRSLPSSSPPRRPPQGATDAIQLCLYNPLPYTPCSGSSIGPRELSMKLDNVHFRRTCGATVNPNTHQKFIFCASLHRAAGLALYICPERPGAAS